MPKNSCVVTICRAVQDEPGIHEIRWDTVQRVLELRYDRNLDGTPRFERTVDAVTHHLEERSALCPDRNKARLRRGCGDCLREFQADMQRAAAQPCPEDAVEFSRGVFRVSTGGSDGSNGEKTRSPWARRKLKLGPTQREGAQRDPAQQVKAQQATEQERAQNPGKTAEAASSGAEPEAQQGLVARMRAVPWEPVFVVITLAGMIAGAITERTAPGSLPWVFYTIAYLTGGYFGVRASVGSLREHRMALARLKVLAALGAASVGAPFEGALLLFLFSLSNVLQDFALDRTRSAIKALSKLRPDTALVIDTIDSNSSRLEKVENIVIDQLIQVKPGSRIPLDGVLMRGASSIDQSSITGESMPVEKTEGEDVLAGTINQDGEFVMRVTKTSNESTIARVITLVEEAREKQAKSERFMDSFEQYYAIVVIAVTILAGLLPPLLLGMEWGTSVYRAITLMVAASPCALIISTPASILSSIGNGARRGILFKGGVHVEQAAGIQAVAFDKTGTLTEGTPHVQDIISLSDWDDDELLAAAAALESKSEHVIARAVVQAAEDRRLDWAAPQDFRSESGVGVRGRVGSSELMLGSPSLLERIAPENETGSEANSAPQNAGTLQPEIRERILRLQQQSKTVIVLVEVPQESESGSAPRVLGLIALMDRLRPGVREVIADLRNTGIRHVVMLTGDNEAAAQAIAAEAGIDTVFPELLPEHKLDAIRRIEEQYGPTAMIGDGVNDAPALAGARLGIAMGAAGTDVALETADIVLLSDDLQKIPYLMALSRATRRTLIANISIALGLILMMIVGIYTIDLPLPLAVVGHEGGTVLVSLNGVRLLLFNRKPV